MKPAFLLAAVLASVLKDAGTFLVINQPPRKADVIIVLNGDNGARLQRGIELYRQGYAPYLLYTSSTNDMEEAEAVAEGVPPNRFILDRQAQNTYQNAERSKVLMDKYGFHSAVVVSSDYQMRRASLIFVVDKPTDGAAYGMGVHGLPSTRGWGHHGCVGQEFAVLVCVQVHALRAKRGERHCGQCWRRFIRQHVKPRKKAGMHPYGNEMVPFCLTLQKNPGETGPRRCL